MKQNHHSRAGVFASAGGGSSQRRSVFVGSVALVLAGCNARLAVLDDDIESAGAAGAAGSGADAGATGAGAGTGGAAAGSGGATFDPSPDGGVATPAACDDGQLNGAETSVDCGGRDCLPCNTGAGCTADRDCWSSRCSDGVCQLPTCTDGVQNRDEAGVDCGGNDCAECPGTYCNCAQSPSMLAFCDGAAGRSNGFSFVPPLVSDDARAIAFDLCFNQVCQPTHWTAEGGTRILTPPAPSGSKTIGMTGDGQRVLVSPPLVLGAEALVYKLDGSALPTGLRPSPALLSADGSVVGVTVTTLGSTNLMRWTEAGGLEALATLPFDVDRLVLHATTPAASVIVGTGESESGLQAFRWSEPGGLELGLEPLPEAASAATITALSRDGATVAGHLYDGSDISGVFHATGAGDPVQVGPTRPTFGSTVLLSDDGSVVIGSFSTEQGLPAAVRWTSASGALSLTPGLMSTATAASGDGSVVVGEFPDYSADPPAQTPWFVWDAQQGARDLLGTLQTSGVDLSGWDIYGMGTRLSRDGKVMVGYGACGGTNTVFRMVLPE